MSDSVGPVVYSDENDEVFLGKDYGHVNNYSEATSAKIDAEIEKMMRKAYADTENILKEHYDKLVLIAETLIKNEKISGEEFESLMKTGLLPVKDEAVVDEVITSNTEEINNVEETSENSENPSSEIESEENKSSVSNETNNDDLS